MGISEEITRLAAEFDPQKDQEKLAVRAAMQGALLGGARAQSVIKIADMKLGMDPDGNYEHHFIIVTESGIRIRVSVEVE